MKCIMVVDDDPVSLTTAKTALQEKYALVLLKSGHEAISFLKKRTCDLILLDYEMPLMSGVKVLEKLRGDSRTKQIPVMFLTGNNDSGKIYTALALKPDGYILKPFNVEDLQQRVAQIIG